MAAEKEHALVTSFPLLQGGDDGNGASGGSSAPTEAVQSTPAADTSSVLDSLFTPDEPSSSDS
jgi:hypothetical protein